MLLDKNYLLLFERERGLFLRVWGEWTMRSYYDGLITTVIYFVFVFVCVNSIQE